MISPLHLGVYLHTLKSEGWYIFGIREDLPLPNFDANWGNADNWHLVEDLLNRATNKTATATATNSNDANFGGNGEVDHDEDEDLQVMNGIFQPFFV